MAWTCAPRGRRTNSKYSTPSKGGRYQKVKRGNPRTTWVCKIEKRTGLLRAIQFSQDFDEDFDKRFSNHKLRNL